MSKTMTFQQIYDFCLLDAAYNAYFNIPDQFKCKSRNQYRYYYNNLSSRGQSRAGTYIYSQSMRQLERFLNKQQQDFYFHINEETFEEVDYQKFEGKTIYIVAHIRGNGVQIEYNHPYKCSYEQDRIWFIPRSHNRFDKQGLIKEVQNHINTKLLFPPGRYRELQEEYRIPKEKFVDWYRHEYKWSQERKHEQEHWDMIEKYTPDNSVSFEDSLDLLRASGMFYDFGIDDEYEQEEMADQFMRMCNR
ncbi:hypothetical protein [Dysgonomonas termitidis]|uniref:Transposase n=1 Tax=Dysgonomonas termitidis TaxID=1516126 RepID=A0ABV9KRC5_9BACT